jgi:hypothetical protein
MRNKLIHAYDAVDLDLVWTTAREIVPDLLRDLEATLQRQRDASDAELAARPAGERRGRTAPIDEAPVAARDRHSTSALPDLIVHADWSTSPTKRWLARAALQPDGRYRLFHPEPVGDASSLLRRLRTDAGATGGVLVGFDFPIGLPEAYARQAEIADLPTFLGELTRGKWPEFFAVATRLQEVSLRRPFFPAGNATGLKQQDFLQALGLARAGLYRRCERARPDRAAAAPLFWTVGGNQVGKAALAGWRDVLCPAIADPTLDVAIWPFAGPLADLMLPGRLVAAETYPAECYVHLGLDLRLAPTLGKFGKRVRSSRAANAPTLVAWARDRNADLEPALVEALANGFGPHESGEDAFDAVVGLFGMLTEVLGEQPTGEPDDERVRGVEGWILGQPA